MSPRPDVSEERKSQIMNAAEKVFIKKGLDEARMEDVAAETGLSKGTLYLYFKSKDQLIFSILEKFLQGFFKQLDASQDQQISATDAIHEFNEEVLEKYIRSSLNLLLEGLRT